MSVLITGATGFIGRRLLARLADDGVATRALVLPGEDASMLGNADVRRGDITVPESLTAAFAGVSRVYHLAAWVGDWGDERRIWQINVDGTRNVLAAACAAGCDRAVVVSSVAVYGSALRGDVCDEETTVREYGVGPYSRSKRAAEEIALDCHNFGRVPVVVVRPGNVYGPGSALWVDEVVRQLRSNRLALRLPLIDGGAGNATLAYVDNVVDVILRAGRADDAPGRIYNANDDSEVTWRQYFADLARVVGVAEPRWSLPGSVVDTLAVGLEAAGRLRRSPKRPLITREAVALLRSRARVSVRRARDDLGYYPLVPYEEAMNRVATYLGAHYGS
jgi:2-alkyl-3-oxoalkanoate reductase